MRVNETPTAFARHLASGGLSVDTLTVQDGLRAVADFYRTTRAKRVDLEADGDMLLFQWGTYDWGQSGNPTFEYDLTRQLIVPKRSSDDEFRQLSLTFRFQTDPALEDIGSGNEWCGHPSALEDFEAFVLAHPATIAVADRSPLGVDLRFEDPE